VHAVVAPAEGNGGVLASEVREKVLEPQGAAAGDDYGRGFVVDADKVNEGAAGTGLTGGVEAA
jgi:hypothetical protein